MIAAFRKLFWGWVLSATIRQEERERRDAIVHRYDRGELGDILPDEAQRDLIYALYCAGRLVRADAFLPDADEISRPMSCQPNIDDIIREAGL